MKRFYCPSLALLVTIGLLLPTTAAAGISSLAAFLERAERMAGYPAPVRADILVRNDSGSTDHAVLIVDPAVGRQFFAVKSSGWRALLPLDWEAGKAVVKPGAKTVAQSADDLLAGMDLRGMDFFSFWKTDYATAFISDDSRLEKTTTLFANKRAPYLLFVITFDKAKMVPLVVKYYKDALNNLVRLRRNANYVMVGSRLRPQKIEVQDFTENRTTKFQLRWRVLERVPAGLSSAAGFAKATVDWPEDPLASE